MLMGDEKYVALTTFTKNGHRKVTPVWIAEVDDQLGLITGSDAWKLRRLRNDPRCELQPCDFRGKVRDDAMVATGRGREATTEEYRPVREAIEDKYGLAVKLIAVPGWIMGLFGRGRATSDAAILITLD